jgi:hypothetical protein
MIRFSRRSQLKSEAIHQESRQTMWNHLSRCCPHGILIFIGLAFGRTTGNSFLLPHIRWTQDRRGSRSIGVSSGQDARELNWTSNDSCLLISDFSVRFQDTGWIGNWKSRTTSTDTDKTLRANSLWNKSVNVREYQSEGGDMFPPTLLPWSWRSVRLQSDIVVCQSGASNTST